jgi:hypothetical protein
MGNQRIADMWDIDCGLLHHAESNPLRRRITRCTQDRHCEILQGADLNHRQSRSRADDRSVYKHDACTN